MKRESLDLNTVNNSNLTDVINSLQNMPPKGAVLLDKSLLPSRGKLYNEDIYVKKISVKDIRSLAAIDESNIQGTINSVLQSCIYGIKINDILVGDKIWLIFYLRAFTYDDFPFPIRGTCDECNTIATYDYKLNNLDVLYLEKDVPDEIELGEDKIKISFPTIQTESDMIAVKTNDQCVDEISGDLLELAAYIRSVNGNELSLLKAYRYLNDMDAFTFSKFTNILTEYVFTAKPAAKFTCKKCGKEITLPISFVPAFFLPKV